MTNRWPRPSRPPHQLQVRCHSKAALAGQRGRFQAGALRAAAAGKADADLMAAEDRNITPGRRVLLVEHLPLPAAVRRAVAADIVEEGVATQDAPVIEQHHAA